ncbi:MAG: NifB/NifX family molybdenum-iron cluster-binding protein [Dethiobacteria bacterium]
MKLAICAQGEGPDVPIDRRFGRSPFFVIIDTENEEFKTVANPHVDAAGGAGPQSAQLLEQEGVEAVVVGNIGPHAMAVLDTAGIRVYTGLEGTVRDTYKKFADGKLTLSGSATVSPHHGSK